MPTPLASKVSISDPISDIILAMDNDVLQFDAEYELMGRENGVAVTEVQHLLRSLVDLLTTAIGTYPTLREYGCRLTDFIDLPANGDTKLRMLSAIFTAIGRWEPRIIAEVISLTYGDADGRFLLDISGKYLLGGQAVAFHNITLDFKKNSTVTA